MLAQVELDLDGKYSHLYYVNITTRNYRDFRKFCAFSSNFSAGPDHRCRPSLACFWGPGTASVIVYGVTNKPYNKS